VNPDRQAPDRQDPDGPDPWGSAAAGSAPPRPAGRRAFGRLAAAAAAAAVVLAPPPPAAAGAALAGVWTGTIAYVPAELEIEVLVEIGETADGGLAGTIDVPVAKIEYRPLQALSLDGSAVAFDMPLQTHAGGSAVYTFRGTLSDDGGEIAGRFHGWLERGTRDAEFRLARTGDPGGERLDWGEPPALADLSPAGAELAAAFDADRERVRLVLMLSPTCGVCLSSARIVQRYVLDAVADERLAAYVVWGPMLGEEERADAERATVFLADERSRHFWTPRHDLAEALGRVLGLPAGEPAWDVYLVYPAGARWPPGAPPPAPATVMHIERSLPAECGLNGEALRRAVEAALAAGGAEAEAAAGTAPPAR
jgi:hypothetical protein